MTSPSPALQLRFYFQFPSFKQFLGIFSIWKYVNIQCFIVEKDFEKGIIAYDAFYAELNT